jgi:hypothetical protein
MCQIDTGWRSKSQARNIAKNTCSCDNSAAVPGATPAAIPANSKVNCREKVTNPYPRTYINLVFGLGTKKRAGQADKKNRSAHKVMGGSCSSPVFTIMKLKPQTAETRIANNRLVTGREVEVVGMEVSTEYIIKGSGDSMRDCCLYPACELSGIAAVKARL